LTYKTISEIYQVVKAIFFFFIFLFEPLAAARSGDLGLRERSRAMGTHTKPGSHSTGTCIAALIFAVALFDSVPAAADGPLDLATDALAMRALQQLEQAQLMDDGPTDDKFGCAVAICGDTAVVGAEADKAGGQSILQGAAYVFVRSGSVWTQQQKLTASDGTRGDAFGCAVAIDGNTVIVGSMWDDIGANDSQGSAYVFTRSGTKWTQQQKLTTSDGAADDWLGGSLALSGDTALIGVENHAVGGKRNQGAAYVFVRSGSVWTQQQKLTAPDGAAWDAFGCAVAIDGTTALIAADSHLFIIGQHTGFGAAYVFTRSGSTWSLQQMLTATDFSGAHFGDTVALSGDTALVGRSYDDIGANDSQGSAYVFTRSGTKWTQQQKLIAADSAAGDIFGSSVALSGNIAVIGAPWNGARGAGAAYVFVRSGAIWTQQEPLTASNGEAWDHFGDSVAICGDTAVVAAWYSAPERGQGSVYIFQLDVVPPQTSLSLTPGANVAGWHGQPVTVKLRASDAASGVAAIYYRLGDAGPYSVYDDADRPVVSQEGVTRIWYYSTDRAGNTKAAKKTPVRIDRFGPITKALAGVTVKRGQKATLRLSVDDPVSHKAAVTVKITKGSAVKATLKLGWRATNSTILYRFTCSLPLGTYSWRVYATDLAGNAQSKVGSRTFVVK
jgi:hypothetical protein